VRSGVPLSKLYAVQVMMQKELLEGD
jgi:hypothetical protein